MAAAGAHVTPRHCAISTQPAPPPRPKSATSEGEIDVRGEAGRVHTTENRKESHQGSEPDKKEKARWIDGNVSVIKFVLPYTCSIL